jgi:hypothetical protein
MKYTGVRQEQYDEIKTIRKSLTVDSYRAVIRELNTRQVKANKEHERAEARRIAKALQERERINKLIKDAEKAKKQRIQDKKKNVIVDIVIPQGKVSTRDEIEEYEERVVEACKKLVGKTKLYIQFSKDNTVVDSAIETVKGRDNLAIYYNCVRKHIYTKNGSEGSSIFDNEEDTQPRKRFVILLENTIPSTKIIQKYRDGVVHCVLQPLIDMKQSQHDNAVSNGSKLRLKQIVTKLIHFRDNVYVDGVPENDLHIIGKCISARIEIKNIVGGTTDVYNERSSNCVKFTNTRKNHVENGNMTFNNVFDDVTSDKIQSIYDEHKQNGDFFLYTSSEGNIISLRSLKGCWCVKNPNHHIFNEFNNSIGINDFKLDAIKYPELNRFIVQGRLINSSPVSFCENPNDESSHLDLVKAYTQHRKAKFYNGFMGHITHWCTFTSPVTNDFLDTHLGIFGVDIVSSVPLLERLGLKAGLYTIAPSVEIKYWISLGCEVSLKNGCWGNRFDFDYNEEMLNNRLYTVWAGKLGIDREDDRYEFHGDQEWASHLKATIGDDRVFYYGSEKKIVLTCPRKTRQTLHHVLAFITAYTRINMIEMMRSVKGELVKVVLDGLYYRGTCETDLPTKEKPFVEHSYFNDGWYTEHEKIEFPAYDKRFDSKNVLCLTGAGGTGKSYSVFNKSMVIEPLYVVPSHILGRKFRDTWKCNYTTINQLIGIECEPYKVSKKYPSVIFIDEITMIDKDWIQQALDIYKDSFIILAGDVDKKQWFQCRNGYPGNFSEIWLPQNCDVVHYETDYRSQDDEIKSLKYNLRQVMTRIFTDGNQLDTNRITRWILDNNKVLSFADACVTHKDGDLWLAGTHKTNKLLLDKNICSGYIAKDKSVSYTEIEGEKRGSFTVHAFQGLTISDKKVFIKLDTFEYAMIYTAISRCTNMSQIVFVK